MVGEEKQWKEVKTRGFSSCGVKSEGGESVPWKIDFGRLPAAFVFRKLRKTNLNPTLHLFKTLKSTVVHVGINQTCCNSTSPQRRSVLPRNSTFWFTLNLRR